MASVEGRGFWQGGVAPAEWVWHLLRGVASAEVGVAWI